MPRKRPKKLIADLEKRIREVKQLDRKFDNRAKIVIGAGFLAEMRRNPRIRQYYLDNPDKFYPRQQDRDSLRDVLEELHDLSQADASQNARQAIEGTPTSTSTIPDQNPHLSSLSRSYQTSEGGGSDRG